MSIHTFPWVFGPIYARFRFLALKNEFAQTDSFFLTKPGPQDLVEVFGEKKVILGPDWLPRPNLGPLGPCGFGGPNLWRGGGLCFRDRARIQSAFSLSDPRFSQSNLKIPLVERSIERPIKKKHLLYLIFCIKNRLIIS